MKNANYLIILSIALAATYCSKKSTPTTASSSTSGSATENQGPMTVQEDTSSGAASSSLSDSSVIYFEYDQATLTSDGRSKLQSVAPGIKGAASKVTIEGHADERGSNEYNLALGESRARAVRDYLRKLGVPSDKMNTVSYGEEKPADLGQGEQAWSKNRRAEISANN